MFQTFLFRADAAAAVFPWFSTTSLSGNARVSDVRFGSKADICGAQVDVRFTPKSGHVQCNEECPLCAKSGHWTFTRLAPYDPRFSSEKARNG
jgi:hypothetical protein